MQSSVIESIGTAVPKFKIAQSAIFEFMSEAYGLTSIEKTRMGKIYSSSGIDFRHSVIDDYEKKIGDYSFYGNNPGLEPFPSTEKRVRYFQLTAVNLAVEAVHDCIQKIPEFSYESITHIITVSCTGLHAPGIDIDLVGRLGLSNTVERTCINFMGCYAAFNAMKSADYIIKASPLSRILVVCVELCTLHFQKENTLQNWLANALFSDGAAAVVISAKDVFPVSKSALKIEGFYAQLLLDAKKEMAWSIGNFGFEMNLGSHVTKKIKSFIKPIAYNLLQKLQLDFDNIAHFAIHPGGRRILEVCEEELGFKGGKDHPSYQVLRDFGNMSSATIFFVLNNLCKQMELSQISKGTIMSFAFGPGLTFESMVLVPAYH